MSLVNDDVFFSQPFNVAEFHQHPSHHWCMGSASAQPLSQGSLGMPGIPIGRPPAWPPQPSPRLPTCQRTRPSWWESSPTPPRGTATCRWTHPTWWASTTFVSLLPASSSAQSSGPRAFRVSLISKWQTKLLSFDWAGQSCLSWMQLSATCPCMLPLCWLHLDSRQTQWQPTEWCLSWITSGYSKNRLRNWKASMWTLPNTLWWKQSSYLLPVSWLFFDSIIVYNTHCIYYHDDLGDSRHKRFPFSSLSLLTMFSNQINFWSPFHGLLFQTMARQAKLSLPFCYKSTVV